MNTQRKKLIIIVGVIVVIAFIIIPLVFSFFQTSTSTQKDIVIIDNASEYSTYISDESYTELGHYLYNFIDEPTQSVYSGTIVEGSYDYASNSWFSSFIVALKDSDISWDVSLQTLKNGEINGDISVTCASGKACLAVSPESNPTAPLQSYLPITTNDFIINIESDDSSVLTVIYYDQEGTGKTKALEAITTLGFNPEDYTINYYYGGR